MRIINNIKTSLKKSVIKSGRFANKGISLIETMLVIVVILAITAGVYKFYDNVRAKEVAFAESQNITRVTDRILKAMTTLPDFSEIDNNYLVQRGIIPTSMAVDASTATVRSGFGSTVVFAPETVNGEADVAFSILYNDVPSRSCASLVTSSTNLQRFSEISISSSGTVFNDKNIVDNGIVRDMAELTSACGGAEFVDIKFVYQRQDVEAGASLADEVCQTLPNEVTEVPCPAGTIGTITKTRVSFCPDTYGLPSWTTDTVNFPDVGSCETRCVPNQPTTRTEACPSGQIGTGIVYKTTSSCPSETGAPVWNAEIEFSRDCSDQCVPLTETRSVACPSEYVGTMTQEKYWTCPTSTSLPVEGSWVTINQAFACTPRCQVPYPSVISRWDARVGSCGSGYSGTESWSAEQTKVASCPSLTGTVAWTDWTDTGNTTVKDRSGCSSSCLPESPTAKWVFQNIGCPSGYVGVHTLEAEYLRTSVCATGASSPTTSAWAPSGRVQNEVNTCSPSNCSIPGGTVKTWTSTDGQATCTYTIPSSVTISSGLNLNAIDVGAPATGSAQFLCDNGVLSATASTGSSCGFSSCLVPANTTYSWSNGSNNCEMTTGSTPEYIPAGQSLVTNDNSAPLIGSATFECQAGSPSISTTATNAECSSSCPNKPVDTNQTFYCAEGKYGSWTQTTSWTSGLPAQCWVSSKSPLTEPVGACTTCPSNTTRVLKRQVARVDTCPSGSTGSWTYDMEQSQTVDVTYSCPAGTTSAPVAVEAPAVEANWSDTGVKYNEVNTCKSSCTVSGSTAFTWGSGSVCSALPASGTYTHNSPLSVSDAASPWEGSAVFRCNNGTMVYESGSCAESSCVIAPNSLKTWTASSNNCTGTSGASSQTIAHNGSVNFTDNGGVTDAFGGIATYTCNNGSLSVSPTASSCQRTHCTSAPSSYSWVAPDTSACSVTTSTTTYTPFGGTFSVTDSSGAATGSASYACNSPNATPEVTPTSSTCSTTCGPAPITPISPIAKTCAAGQYGSWTQTGYWAGVASPTCWAVAYTPLTEPVGACTTCPSPQNFSETGFWDARTGTCPSGYSGSVTWEQEQGRTRTESYSCPAGTSVLPAPSIGYSAYSDIIGSTRNLINTCTQDCVPEVRTKTLTRQVAAACPVNTTGIAYRKEDYSGMSLCPSGASPTWLTSAQETAYQTTNIAFPTGYPDWTLSVCYDRNGTPMSCSTWDTSQCLPTASCDVSIGQTFTWGSGSECSFTATSASTVLHNNTLSPSDSAAPWNGSAVFRCNNGTLSYESGSCTQASCSIPANTSRTWSNCTGTSGASLVTIAHGATKSFSDSSFGSTTSDLYGGTANYICNNGTLSSTEQSGATCNQTHCLVSASTPFSWTGGGVSCGASSVSNSFVAVGSNYSISDASGEDKGTGYFACSAGSTSVSATQGGSSTCSRDCGLVANPGTPVSQSCPAGYWGTWNGSWTTAAAPTCWTQTFPLIGASTCSACSNTSTTIYRTQARAPMCSAGQYGTWTYNMQQSQSVAVSYSCPAGTTSLPAGTQAAAVEASWADTGLKSSEVNTCTTCPANTTTVKYRTVPRSDACGANQTGGPLTYDMQQSQTVAVTYSCPAGTTSAPVAVEAPVVAGNWVDTGVKTNQAGTCLNSCVVSAGQAFNWGSGSVCGFNSAATTITSGNALSTTDSTAPWVGTATYRCTNGVLAYESGSCVAASCPISAGQVFSWGSGCSASSLANTVANSASVNFTNTAAGKTGSASFTCSNGTLSLAGGSTCNATSGFSDFTGDVGGMFGADLTLGTNGLITVNGDYSNLASSNWWSPTQAGVGSTVWMRATKISGALGCTGSVGVWNSMGTARTYAVATSGSTVRSCTYKFEFSMSSSGTPIAHTVNVILNAEGDGGGTCTDC